MPKSYQFFNYYRSIEGVTTSAGTNTSTTVSGFPVCVHINGSSWPTAAERTNFFCAANSGGARVQFFASDLTTNLAYDIEYYDAPTQEALYWVRVPSVQPNTSSAFQ
jgi:hypothetical protein